MSAFLNAIYNFDNIQVDEKLKPVLKEMLLLFHKNDKLVNLSNSFNVKEFFERHLFTNTQKDLPKVKISMVDNFGDYKKEALGIFDIPNCHIKIKKLPDDSNITSETLEEDYLKTLAHEFVHFLTLYGSVTVYDKKEKFIIPDYFKDPKINHPHYITLVAYFEPLTEITSQILIGHNKFHAYNQFVKIMEMINNLFDINDYIGFFQRNLYDHVTILPVQLMQNYINIHSPLMENAKHETEKEAVEALELTIEEVLDDNKNTQLVKKFIKKQISLKEGLDLEKSSKSDNIIRAKFKDGNILLFSLKNDELHVTNYGFRQKNNVNVFMPVTDVINYPVIDEKYPDVTHGYHHSIEHDHYSLTKVKNGNYEFFISTIVADYNSSKEKNKSYPLIHKENEEAYAFTYNQETKELTILNGKRPQKFDMSKNTKQEELNKYTSNLNKLIKNIKNADLEKETILATTTDLILKPDFSLTVK